MRRGQQITAPTRMQALTEGKMLLELDHPNVIKYYDFFLHQERGGVGTPPARP